MRRDSVLRAPKPGRCLFFWLIVFFSQYIFLQSSFFAIEAVKVFGNKLLATETVINNIGVPVNRSLLFINSGKVARHLLDSFYQIRAVQIQKKIPRTLEIYLEERSYHFSLLAGETIYAVDEDGVVLYEILDPSKVKSPVVTMENYPVSPGNRLNGVQIQSVISAIPVIRKQFSDKEVAMMVSKEGEVDIEFEPSIKVKLGIPKDLAEKLQLLPSLLRTVEEKKLAIQYIDLRFKDTPVVKVK